MLLLLPVRLLIGILLIVVVLISKRFCLNLAAIKATSSLTQSPLPRDSLLAAAFDTALAPGTWELADKPLADPTRLQIKEEKAVHC